MSHLSEERRVRRVPRFARPPAHDHRRRLGREHVFTTTGRAPAALVRARRVIGGVIVAVLAFLPAAGCGDDGPGCPPDVLDNSAEEALARHVLSSASAMTAGPADDPAAPVVDAVASFHRDEPVVDADQCTDRARALTTYELIVHYLVARPDLATSGLVSGLVDAAQKGGVGGLLNFVEGADFTDQEYPGLEALRELLDGQDEAAGAGAPGHPS